MIKINLLPKSIYQKRTVKRTAMLFAVILVAVIAAGITYSVKLAADVRDMEQQASDAEAWESRVKQIQAQAQGVRSSAEPIKWKLDHINAVLEYNVQYPKLYEEIAKWTYEKVNYTSMQSNGSAVAMTARVKTLDDLGRYLLNMYRATDLFTQVSISGVPGYPKGTSKTPGAPGIPGGPGGGVFGGPTDYAGLPMITESIEEAPVEEWIDFQVNCTLKNPISAPSFETGAAAEGAAGTTGPGGTPGGGGAVPGPGAVPPAAGPPTGPAVSTPGQG